MIVTEDSVKKLTNSDLESWKKYFYDRVQHHVEGFEKQKKKAVDHFVEIEAEMTVKQEMLADSLAPKVPEKQKGEMHGRITQIQNELNVIRDSQKSAEIKTNAQLDFIRKQIILIEDEIQRRDPPKDDKKAVKKVKKVKKTSKKK